MSLDIKSEELRGWRVSLGLSREELAPLLDVSVSTISRWEKVGVATPVRSKTAWAVEKLRAMAHDRPQTAQRDDLGPPYFQLLAPEGVDHEWANLSGYLNREAVDAIVAGGEIALAGGSPLFLLVFGLPGVGKTSLAGAAAYELRRRGFDFAVLRIFASTLALQSDRTLLRHVLNRLTDTIVKWGPHSMLIIIDDLESATQAPERAAGGSEQIIAQWMLRILHTIKSRMSPTLVIAVANSPNQIDPALQAEFSPSVYVPIPDRSEVASLLERSGYGNSNEIAERLEIFAKTNNVIWTSRALLQAMSLAPHFKEDARDASPEESARLLATLASSTPASWLHEYESENRVRVKQAELFLALLKSRSRKGFPSAKGKVK